MAAAVNPYAIAASISPPRFQGEPRNRPSGDRRGQTRERTHLSKLGDSCPASGYAWGASSPLPKAADFDDFRNGVRQLGFHWRVVNEPLPASAPRQS